MFDYNQLWMEFGYMGRQIRLNGLNRLQYDSARPASLRKSCTDSAQFYQLTVESIDKESNLDPKYGPNASVVLLNELKALLREYTELFTILTGLPPVKDHDHRIPLLPGTALVNVKLYRYSHFQKSDIEELVGEMLADEIIRPSTCPLSSPVLLVTKNDGTWRFCVDYRALNAATVKDRFPIPMVDELLDEISDARIFSKLDLRAGYHQVRIHPDDVEKTAFRTHDGHFKFLVLPLGLTNASSTF